MPASTLAYNSVVQSVGGTGTFLDLMDAIYTVAGSLTKWSIESNVGGAGAREVVELSADAGSFPDQRVVYAGRSAGTPAMQSPDTFLANALLIATEPDGGTAFVGATWHTGAALYAAGRPLDFSRASAAVTTFAEVQFLESADDIWLLIRTSTNTYYGIRAGAWMRTPILAEGEGSTYCFVGYQTSGSNVISTTWAGITTAWLGHNTGIGAAHSYVYQPGTSNLWTVNQRFRSDGVYDHLSTTGEDFENEIPYKRLTPTTAGHVGYARGTYYASGQWRTQIAGGGKTRLVFGPSNAANVDAVALLT